jgi:hypothetical protein
MYLPRISFTVPSNVFANDRGRMIRAILNISSSETFPSCLTKQEISIKKNLTGKNSLFFCFFLSRGGSLSALMTSDDAEGITSILALRFCTVSFTVTRMPFQSPVALAISSPTFFGDYILIEKEG